MDHNKKHILFHRPTPWDSEINCSTKVYAKIFSEAGYKVTYLQGAINVIHRVLKRGYYTTWRKGSRFEKRIWVTAGCSLVPYLSKPEFLARVTSKLSYNTCVPSINSLVQRSGYGTPDIIWTTIPGSTVLKDIFPRSKLFFHVIDKYSAYRGDAVTVVEANDYKKADHIFVIGQALSVYLQEKFEVKPEKITNLGQGVALNKYQGEFSIPEELRDLPRPIAIWVGLIKKLDIGLLQAAAGEIKRLGGATVLIGPGFELIKDRFTEEDHLTCLGTKPSSEIPDYLRSSDMGLMLYDRQRQDIYEGQNPLKLYEYAAAGLPTLSTHHKEFEYLNPPVLKVDSEREVIEAIGEAITNRAQIRVQMLEFARFHSWESCKERAESVFLETGI